MSAANSPLKGGISYRMCGKPSCSAMLGLEDRICPCHSIRYCSLYCQKMHWKHHKVICVDNRVHLAGVAPASVNNHLIPSVSRESLHKLLKRWVKFHAFNLLGATIHALELPKDIRRSQSHIVRMRVAMIGGTSLSSPETSFRVELLCVLEQSDARAVGRLWNESLDKVVGMREESESTGRGTVAVMFIECEALGLHVLPFGSLKNLDTIREVGETWLEIVLRAIEQGQRVKRFEDFDCVLVGA